MSAADTGLQVLALGHAFEAGRTSFPVGGYVVPTLSGLLFAIALDGITEAEQRAFDGEDAEFALYAAGPVGVLLYRFGAGIPWSDACFNILNGGRIDAETVAHFADMRARERERMIVSLALIEARTGIVRGLRALTFSPVFSMRFLDVVHAQIERGPVDDNAFRTAVHQLYAGFPTTKALLGAAIARTIGGF